MTSAACETKLEILGEWADQNGHMNVAYYVLAFDRATDALYDQLGIGWSYLERARRSLFTLAMNVDYLGEVFAGDRVRIVSRLIDCDHASVRRVRIGGMFGVVRLRQVEPPVRREREQLGEVEAPAG